MSDTAAEAASDKRAHERKRTIYYFKVFDRETGKLAGHVVDISACGMMLVGEEPFEYGRVYALRMGLPFEINGSSDICFDATKVWSDSDVNDDYLDTGFYFDYISDEDTQRIYHLIESYSFRN